MTESQLQRKRHSSHGAVFFRNWLQDPFNVASIAPSGRLLAKLMATGLGAGSRVVELGGGTGTLTQGILDSGVSPLDLHVVEQNAAFVDILKIRFPGVHVVPADAASATQYLGEVLGSIDYVISGLPLLWFDKDKKTRILSEAFSLLRPDGCFHQFTYLGRPPVGGRILAGLRLKASLIGMSPINLPPAFVYRFQRALS
jgi:phospholipid N-methyltransferase